MPLTGGFRQLADLRERIASVQEVPAATAKAAPADIDPLVSAQYAAGTDPYGSPWAPLSASTVRRGRRGPPLTRSGRMRRGTRATATPGNGVGLVLPFPGPIHQAGSPSTGLPSRQVAPSGRIPSTWSLAVSDQARRQMAARLKR